MEWMRVKPEYKLDPNHIVIESSAGRLILCNVQQISHYDAEMNMTHIVEEHHPVIKFSLNTYLPLDKEE